MDGRGGSQDVRKRGATQIDLIVTDGHDGLLAAVSELFTAPPSLRCLVRHPAHYPQCYPQARTRGDTSRTCRHLESADKDRGCCATVSEHSRSIASAIGEAVRSLTEDEEHLLTFYEFPVSRASAHSDDQCHPEPGKSMCGSGLIRSMYSRQKPVA
jgi:transposase-like protein